MKTKSLASLALLSSAFAFTSCLEDNPDYAAGVPSPIISLEDVRRLYQGSDVVLETGKLAGAHQIVGVVISDPSGKNVPGGSNTVVIQNKRRGAIRGIILPLNDTPTNLAAGDSVVVDIAGATLSKANGALRIEGLTAANIEKVGSNKKPTIREVNIQTLLTALDTYEGTLVRITGGSLNPVPVSGDTYKGDKVLADGSNNSIVLHTEAEATFATRRMPASATFVGIPVGTAAAPQLWMRTANDALDPSGPIYAKFPESFEAVPATAKSKYDMTEADGLSDNTVTFGTGPWKLYQAILGNTAGRDRYTGTQGIRMQQNLSVSGYVEMKFDVPNGATKVTLIYGAYYNDASSSWKLEYSQDQGKTWKQTGPTVTDAGSWQHSITFLLNISGPVRFRINKLGLGQTNQPTVANGRLGLDDIAIYEN